jgi:hypothetical protein
MGSGIPTSSSAGPQATLAALIENFRHSFMEVIRKDLLGDPKVTSDNFLDIVVGNVEVSFQKRGMLLNKFYFCFVKFVCKPFQKHFVIFYLFYI